jgi:hypothetical protein
MVEYGRTSPRVVRDRRDVFCGRPLTIDPQRIRRSRELRGKRSSCSCRGALIGVT